VIIKNPESNKKKKTEEDDSVENQGWYDSS
jgi:hypothetical protein